MCTPDAPCSPPPPRKRKAQGPQQPAPPPTSLPQYTSPPFSQAATSIGGTPRRRRHSRQASELSSRGIDYYGRPRSGYRHRGSSFSTTGGISPPQQPNYEMAEPPTSDSRDVHESSELQDTRQQRVSADVDPEARHIAQDQVLQRNSPERDRQEAREPLPSSARGPSIKRDEQRD